MKSNYAQFWSSDETPGHSYTTEELYELITISIAEGYLKPGDKLLSYWKMGEKADLSKTSVHRIYNRLSDNGWVNMIHGSGTYVSSCFPNYQLLYPSDLAVKSLPLSLGSPAESMVQKECDFHDFATIGFDTPGPYYINGLLRHIRYKEFAADYENMNQKSRIKCIQGVAYKAAILEYLNSKRNFMINADGLEVIIGRNESLQSVFNALLRSDDVVVNTSPKDQLLCSILKSYPSLDIYNINLDDYFLQNLKKLLVHKKIKVLHIRPQCSHADNYSLDPGICTELLLLAKEHGFYILEEDDYHEFWFETRPFVPLVRQDHNGHVIYCGAFSLLSTYLQQTRTIVAAEDFIKLLKSNPLPINQFRNVAMEMAIVNLLNGNNLWQMIKKMQSDMKNNRFKSWFLISNTISEFVKVEQTPSGLSYWLVCPSDEWLKRSLLHLKEEGFEVPYFPYSQSPGAGVHIVKLGFGTWNPEEAERPLQALRAKYSPL